MQRPQVSSPSAKKATQEDLRAKEPPTNQVGGLISNIRAVGFKLKSAKENEEQITSVKQAWTEKPPEKHWDVVFHDIVLLEDDQIKFRINPSIPSVSMPYRLVHEAYHEKLLNTLPTTYNKIRKKLSVLINTACGPQMLPQQKIKISNESE